MSLPGVKFGIYIIFNPGVAIKSNGEEGGRSFAGNVRGIIEKRKLDQHNKKKMKQQNLFLIAALFHHYSPKNQAQQKKMV